MKILQDRSTGDMLVILIAGTVCWTVVASGAMIGVISFVHPQTDVSLWIQRVTSIVNTMIGLLAGFLAGRTDVTIRRKQEQEETEQQGGSP